MEVYGVKPKRFTKEWWKYFWDYYKWHTMGTALAVSLILTCTVQCATQVIYDVQIDFISEHALTDEASEALKAMARDVADDITGNGVNEAFVLSMNMGDKSDPQIVRAMQAKFLIETSYSEGYAFIMSKTYADKMIEQGFLEKTSVWAGDKANDGYVISLAGNKALAEIGIDAAEQDLYIGVLWVKPEMAQDELAQGRYRNGIKFAQYLINQE